MTGFEIGAYIILASLAIAYAVRVVKVYAKLMYDVAPYVMPLLAIVLWMYCTGDLDQYLESAGDNANAIEAVENQGRGGESR